MTQYIDATNIYRMRLIHDLLPCEAVRETIVEMGMIPPGDDSLLNDHRDSHARLDAVVEYMDRIQLMARLCAEISGRARPDAIDGAAVSTAAVEIVADIVEASVTAILANLVQDELRGVRTMRRPTGGPS